MNRLSVTVYHSQSDRQQENAARVKLLQKSVEGREKHLLCRSFLFFQLNKLSSEDKTQQLRRHLLYNMFYQFHNVEQHELTASIK